MEPVFIAHFLKRTFDLTGNQGDKRSQRSILLLRCSLEPQHQCFLNYLPLKPASWSTPSGGEEAGKEAGAVLPHSVHLAVLHVTASGVSQ